MRLQSWLGMSGPLQAGIIVLAIIMAFAAGASGLAYASPYSSLIAAAAVITTAILVAWLGKPVWALYAAWLVVLLPIGLILPQVHSILNRSITVFALSAWVFDVITRRKRIVWTSTSLVMVGFITWGVITLFWAENLSIGTTILQAYTLRLILYLILVTNEIRTKENLDRLMDILALSGWVLALVSVGTVLLEGYAPGTRLQVLSTNENEVGVLAVVTMQGVLWRTIQPSQKRKAFRVLTALAFLVLTMALVAMSGSRGSAISLVATLLAFCLWKPTRPWGIVGLLLLVLGAVIAPFIFSTTLERFAITRGDTLLGNREALWQAAWMLIRDHPWGGVGIGNAPYAVMPYLRPLRSVWEQDWASIHNPVLTIWAESGVLGLVLYLGVLGSALWLFFRQYFRYRRAGPPFLIPYFALVSSVFLGYMLSWIKGGGMESTFTYFLMLALLLIPSCLNIEGRSEGVQVGAQAAEKNMSQANVPGLRSRRA